MNVLVKASELSPLMAASWLRSTLRAALDGGRQPGADEVFTLWRDSVEPSLSAVEAETLAPLVVRATSELHRRAGAACRTLVERLADLEANLEAKETGTSGVAPSETGGWPEPDLPGKPPPPEPFPLGVLPRLAQAFVVEAARSLGAEPAFPALFAFGVMAVAIGGSCVVEVKPGWHESTNLYLLAVAQPGGGKSPALATALRPLEAIQAVLAEQNRLARQSYEDELAEYERARQGHRKGQGVTLPGKPEEPAERRLFVTSATIEALADALNDNPAGIALIQDEGAAWVRSVNQYRSGRGADRQFYLSCWSRAWVEIIRRTARNVSVPTPHLTVLGGLPPEVLGDLADEAGRDDGFLHRVLFAWPDDVMTRLNTEQIPAGVTQAWERFVHSLVVREHVRVLGLTPDAFALAKNWLDGLSEAFRAETLPAFLLGPAAKMKSHLFRFALILHVGEHAGEELSFVPPVDVSAMQKAISLGGFFLAHARRVIPELLAQSGRDDGGEGLEAYVLERILQTGGLELD
ncbi:MAG: DUF3987 domain-containing protein, partial [Bacillota bacterium]|nr:DUF3987 domain-containing protein [Bacillota bacterium]